MLLYGADAYPFVTEAGMNPRPHEMIERSGGDMTNIRTTMNIYEDADADSADMRNAHEKVVHLAIPRT